MNNTKMKCRRCFYGYPLDGGEKAECHITKPAVRGEPFPTVRGCDWCSFWTDEETGEHPLLIPPNAVSWAVYRFPKDSAETDGADVARG